MRIRISTLVLSGLASAALVWGAGSTAYASPLVDHGAATETAEAQGGWVDSLLRQAAEDSGSADGAWTFTGRSSLYSAPVVRPAHRTEADATGVAATESDATEVEAIKADGWAPDFAERVAAAVPGKGASVEPGAASPERGQPAAPKPQEGHAQPAVQPAAPKPQEGHAQPAVQPAAPKPQEGHPAGGDEHCEEEGNGHPGGHGGHGGHEDHGGHEGHGGQGQGQSNEQHQGQGQAQGQGQDQDVNVTVVVKNNVINHLDNSANNSATSNANNWAKNSQSQSNHQASLNVNKAKFGAKEQAPSKPAHPGGHAYGHPGGHGYEGKPPQHGGGEQHQSGSHGHGELAETGSQGMPVLAGLSAAFLAAGAAAMRLGRRRS
ncbi:hypothetical protein [Streptomyces sp. CB01881]|uniref:hypothetical protein n=1 Tax=Streptomyces sp. CB01881 TaxID=2078691 RepID=UPI000CDCDC7B|nr:hypothetical protein [Streptomyces sp. CB01881]AUY52017.1 hypothetical protein C2142_27350 [Streptomyces sp. CB01881]TYC71448.1 hypothetical protein EH183_27340 [Streptomyces sp. CB01881]